MTTTGYIIVVFLIAGFIASVPGLIVYPLWVRRCSRCGHWRASFPHSGFMDLGPDEDGFNTLECEKCHFRKRKLYAVHRNDGGYLPVVPVDDGDGGDG